MSMTMAAMTILSNQSLGIVNTEDSRKTPRGLRHSSLTAAKGLPWRTISLSARAKDGFTRLTKAKLLTYVVRHDL